MMVCKSIVDGHVAAVDTCFLGTADGEMGEWESAKRMFRWQVVIALTQRYCAVEVGSPFGREIVFSSGQFGNWSHTIDGGNQ